MNCVEAGHLVNVFSDGALNARDSALVLGHLKDCSSCNKDWQDLESLRRLFADARQTEPNTDSLMRKISKEIDEEDRLRRRALVLRSRPLALAAGLILLVISGLQISELTNDKFALIDKATSANGTVTAENLVDLVSPGSSFNKDKLSYEIKMLPLPDWQLVRKSIARTATGSGAGEAGSAIARFDFVGRTDTHKKLTCYQAPRGWIKAAGAARKLGDKSVITGVRAGNSWALLSTAQDRDYLFITPSQDTLKSVLASASTGN